MLQLSTATIWCHIEQNPVNVYYILSNRNISQTKFINRIITLVITLTKEFNEKYNYIPGIPSQG